MLNNPLIFGILCSFIITTLYTLIMIKIHATKQKVYNKNNSIILFTISLIIISLVNLFVSSNSNEFKIEGETILASNISNNMLRGTPEF